jgi:hypothetical protein
MMVLREPKPMGATNVSRISFAMPRAFAVRCG